MGSKRRKKSNKCTATNKTNAAFAPGAAIESALLRLLGDSDINEITIKRLCEEADVNRTTFYLHYTSVFDVLGNIREEIITRILKNYTVHKFPHGSEAYTDFLTAVREETGAHAHVGRISGEFERGGDVHAGSEIFFFTNGCTARS